MKPWPCRSVPGVLLLLLLPFATAAAETYRIDPAHSAIRFRLRHLLGTVNGSFRQFSGTIELDREQPTRSSVRVSIQARSIDTGIDKRDEHLRSPEFFAVSKYPEITFQSRSATQTGAQEGDVKGDFTMHGVTKPIVLHVTFLGPGQGAQTTRWRVTTPPLNRYEYGLRWSENVERISMIARDVSVTIEIEAEAVR